MNPEPVPARLVTAHHPRRGRHLALRPTVAQDPRERPEIAACYRFIVLSDLAAP